MPTEPLTADTDAAMVAVVAAMRELVEALDENEAGMPLDCKETAMRWFRRSDARVLRARARCAEITNTHRTRAGYTDLDDARRTQEGK